MKNPSVNNNIFIVFRQLCCNTTMYLLVYKSNFTFQKSHFYNWKNDILFSLKYLK